MAGPTRFAILMGTNEYASPDVANLPFCHADVDLLRQTLEEYTDFEPQNIISRKLTPSDGVTPDEILQELQDHISSAKPGDTILFYYAGHGECVGEDAYLYLPNTNPNNLATTGLNLQSVSDELRADGLVNLRLFDACNTGIYVRDGSNRVDRQKEFVRRLARQASPEGWITLASCRADQSSISKDGNGIFSFSFCEAIREAAPGSSVRPEDLKIAVCEKVAKRAQDIGVEQTPTLNAHIPGNITVFQRVDTRSDDGGDKPSRKASPSELRSRTKVLDEMITPDSGRYIPKLNELRDVTIDLLENHAEAVQVLEGMDTQVAAHRADRVSGDLQRVVVRTVSKEGLRSIHKIETVRDSPFAGLVGGLGAMLTGEPGYVVRQDLGLPESYFTMEIQGPSGLPNARVYVYHCPLHTKVATFYGFEIDIDEAILRGETRSSAYRRRFIDLGGDLRSQLAPMVESACQSFEDAYLLTCDDYLAYLEYEQSIG